MAKVVEGTCGHCGKTIRRVSPGGTPMLVECDCHLCCDQCGEKMTAYTPDLTPGFYRVEEDYDPLGKPPKSEVTVGTLFVCLSHDPPHYSTRKPVEVMLK